jgi:hypothetical protein
MKSTAAGLAALALCGCATLARETLLDRFQAIGIPERTAFCMVDDLEDRLSEDDLNDLARYTLRISRADSTMEAVEELMRIDNPRAVQAVGLSAVECITGFRL